ncbi:hypothetical protein C482_17828 [Natrialba chahannaoensis JCM 10990]|uniref:Uncharacterized protein n=1 Tax=Natrialba chahannaoensis JCM 10990 TaxID=1227492 RepID=M0AAQ6_9EURY|nr:hypothetical protein [Natrialba chahannaoensis]ELY94957.1 hypothetical protein C482_17828 [Natrialba chahannaoensis JCM 10990]
MNRDELLDELSEDILTYVMQGAFPERELAQTISPSQLDERFEDYELLLDLHFILKSDVIEFVQKLPRRLRSIRTETSTVSQTHRGTVNGHVNWGRTIKKRHTQNPRDGSLFVCDNRSENYDIPENLVLKKLLAIIHRTLREADPLLKDNYTWVQETWGDNEQLIDDLQRVVERNVHVRRIREPKAYEPTERMLTTASQSRQEIYREAASLLRSRTNIFQGDTEEIRSLLDETAITPDDEHALFELYVLFQFVATLEQLRNEQAQFKTIASDRQEVARIDGSKEFVLYHDNSARDRNLSFISEPDADREELGRSDTVQRVAQDVAGDYLGKEFENHTGRPDVIVLEIISEETNEHEYLITEVKNSTNTDTIRRGIKETLEYLAFLRVDDEFVFGTDDDGSYFGTGWNGLLVVQDLDAQTQPLAAQSDNEITILQASELETELASVLEQIL